MNPIKFQGPAAAIINLEDANQWEIKKTYPAGSPFSRISALRTYRLMNASAHVEEDIFDLLIKLPKGAQALFGEIKLAMDYSTHMAILPTRLTRNEANKRTTAIKELEQAGSGICCLVPTSGITNPKNQELRFKPATFMMSPFYILPPNKDKEEIVHIWNQCIQMRRQKL